MLEPNLCVCSLWGSAQFVDAANATYPGVYQGFLSAIDVINFVLGYMLAAGCLWSDVDFHDRLLVSTLGPLVVAGFLALTFTGS